MLLTQPEPARSRPTPAAARPGWFAPPGTPWLPPVQYHAGTLQDLAMAPATLESVVRTLQRLEPDDYLEFMLGWYASGLKSFGDSWQYLDLLTVLRSCALLQPRNFLEIGVRRGRSLAVVADAVPGCHLVGFDLWVPDYAGMPNPGPDFVRGQLQSIGHRGEVELIGGDSHATVPRYFADHPGVMFDLINVDGDHSEAGARADLEAVLPHLAVGGVIVMDDIVHPQHRYLEKVWDSLFQQDSRFSVRKYHELGYGVAFAVRRE